MTNGLTSTQTKILTWVVYCLIVFLTTITGWQQVKFTNLSGEYVRLERYKTDSIRIDVTLNRMERKLDQLIIKTK